MEFDFLLLEQLCKLETKSLMGVMHGFLSVYYDKILSTPDYVVATGDIPIALVVHADTVWENFIPDKIFYDRTRKVCLASGQGAGFDDRAGIYAIWKIVDACYGKSKPTIIITTGEEDYGVGAKALAKKPAMRDIKYMIELDRQGKNDCVFYQCANRDFIKYIEGFGFKEARGSYSDITFLMTPWKICGVNLSIGYYNEHSDFEILRVDELKDTIDKVLIMINNKSIPNFEYKENIYGSQGSIG